MAAQPKSMGKRVTLVLAATLIALVVFDTLFIEHHYVFPWQKVPGYLGIIGFVSCIVVVIVSKQLGKAFLQRPEGYDD